METPCLDLEHLYSMQGTPHRALDYMFDKVDDALWAGHDAQEWPAIDAALAAVDFDRCSLQNMVGLLSVTLPVMDKLPSRPAFAAKVRQNNC